MKVLYLIGALNSGGKENLLLGILSQNNLPFETICMYRKTGNIFQAFEATNKKLFHIPTRPIIRYLLYTRTIVKSEDVSIIHAQSSLDAALAYIATIGLNIKLVQTFHGFDSSNRSIWQTIQKIMIRLCNATVCVSAYQKDFYIRQYSLNEHLSNKLHIIHNGINLSKFQNTHHVELGNNFNIVCVGNFTTVRDYMFLCKFATKLKEARFLFDMYFVGVRVPAYSQLYDSCVDYCNAHSLDNVHFLGFRKDVPSILNSSDAFIYSSNEDTFGIAVIESIACGIPTFVNDWAVMKEISNKGEDAIIFKTNDIEDLYAKFIHFVQNGATFKDKFTSQAACRVRKKFSISAHIDSIYSFYKNL